MKKSIIVLIVEHKDDEAIVDKIANRVWNLDGVAHTVEAKLIYQENKGKYLSDKPYRDTRNLKGYAAYIAHLRSLGLCKAMAECMAGQARWFTKEQSASHAVETFKLWSLTNEGFTFWDEFHEALALAEKQDELDLKGLK
jgi:hypothetical protein